MAQLVKCPTPDLSSAIDLRVTSSSPVLGSMLGVEPTKKKKKKRGKGKKREKESSMVVAEVVQNGE